MARHITYLFLLSFLFSSLTLLAQTDSLEVELPAELLFKKTTQSNFRISPNGKLFLELLEENLETSLIIIDIDAYKLKHRIPMGNDPIGEVDWLNDNRVIYNASGEIYAIDIDGTNKAKLVDNKSEKKVKNYYKYYRNYRFNSILSLNEDTDDEIIVEAFDPDGNAYVKKVNVFTGEKETIYDGKKLDVNKWYADKNGNIVLGIRYEKNGWVYVRESESTGEWYPVEIGINGNFFPFKVEAESFINQDLILVDTDFDPEIIYIASNIHADKRKLLKYNFKKRFVVDTLLADTNCDITDGEGVDLRLLFDRKAKKLGGIRYEGILPEFMGTSEDFQDLNTKLKQNHNLFLNDIIDVDAANNRFIIYQWSDTYAGNIGIYDKSENQYSVMFHINQDLNEYSLAKIRTISVETRDGSKISAYLNLPLNYSELEQVPLVVIPHGGPWARDYWELEGFSQFFASKDYAVLRVNYRGSTGFGKKHLLAGVQGMNTVMIDDIVDATQNVLDSYKIDLDKVYMFGHSYGGYATYLALARYPELFDAGVALAAPTDINSWMKKQKKDDQKFSYEYWKTALGKNSSDYYDEISPVSYADQIDAPLLVFHGKYDKIIPVEQAELMEETFKKKGKKNASFRTVQFLGHSFRDSNSIGYILEESHEFYQNLSEEPSEVNK